MFSVAREGEEVSVPIPKKAAGSIAPRGKERLWGLLRFPGDHRGCGDGRALRSAAGCWRLTPGEGCVSQAAEGGQLLAAPVPWQRTRREAMNAAGWFELCCCVTQGLCRALCCLVSPCGCLSRHFPFGFFFPPCC